VEKRGKDIVVVIPPHVTAVLSDDEAHCPSQRDDHIALLAARGRLSRQKETGRRSLAETAMGRYKAIIVRARCLGGQRTEAAIGVAVLNRMREAGRPTSVRSGQKNS
jgi:hypothetical protein